MFPLPTYAGSVGEQHETNGAAEARAEHEMGRHDSFGVFEHNWLPLGGTSGHLVILWNGHMAQKVAPSSRWPAVNGYNLSSVQFPLFTSPSRYAANQLSLYAGSGRVETCLSSVGRNPLVSAAES